MMRGSRFMMHCIVALAMALGAMWGSTAKAAEVVSVAGEVTFISSEVVEVAGRRGLITTETSISSEGRPVSIGAIVVGMPAELEIDASGRALEVRVKGAVE